MTLVSTIAQIGFAALAFGTMYVIFLKDVL